MSLGRWLTLLISLGGLALTWSAWRSLSSDPVQDNAVSILFINLPPFLLGAVISVLPMRKRTRIMLYWLTAAILVVAGALSLFAARTGIYSIIAVIVFLIVAWFENESGEPTRLHRRSDIISNPRTRQ